MIGRAREGCQTSARAGSRVRRHRVGPPGGADASTPIPPGSIAESPCGAPPGGAILSGPSAPETYAGTPEAPNRILGRRHRTGANGRPVRAARDPAAVPVPWPTLPIDRPFRHRRIPSTNGREASLARRPGRTSGLALPGQLRDVAARHPARRRRRAALPDRRPERLRQGLARVPLPLADQPDARPHRRLQRPGRVRRRADRRDRGRGPGDAAAASARGRPPRTVPRAASASRSGSSRPASVARAGRPTSTRATPSPTSSSARPTGWPTRRACRSRSAPATPTTRSSCTAASASARPT